MSELSEILEDVIFRKLEPSTVLQDRFLSPSIGSITTPDSNEGSSTSKETKLIRSQSEPVLGPIFSSSFDKTVYQPKRPDLIWTRTSFGSDEVIRVNDEVMDENTVGLENVEDMEEEEEEDVSPVSFHYPSNMNESSHRYFNRFQPTHHLSSSLPASSMCRGTTQEKVTQELLELTQPLREGVISRERLLPASRMKQVGVGGRGRPRHVSLVGSTLSILSLENPTDHQSSTTLGLPDSVNSGFGLGLKSMSSLKAVNEVPLMVPRPIRAWQP